PSRGSLSRTTRLCRVAGESVIRDPPGGNTADPGKPFILPRRDRPVEQIGSVRASSRIGIPHRSYILDGTYVIPQIGFARRVFSRWFAPLRGPGGRAPGRFRSIGGTGRRVRRAGPHTGQSPAFEQDPAELAG